MVGAALLVVTAARLGDPWKIVSFSIYGAMLVALYVASTLYHSVRGRAKAVLQKFDHCSIYLLIAGSYTPFALVSLRGPWGWSLLGAVWTLAVVGIVQEIWLAKGARVLSLVIYLLMGWLALVAVLPLWEALTPAGFAWLAAGGVLYTVGIIFYVADQAHAPRPRRVASVCAGWQQLPLFHRAVFCRLIDRTSGIAMTPIHCLCVARPGRVRAVAPAGLPGLVAAGDRAQHGAGQRVARPMCASTCWARSCASM